MKTKRIFISRDVRFHENIFPFIKETIPHLSNLVLPHSHVEQFHDDPTPTIDEEMGHENNQVADELPPTSPPIQRSTREHILHPTSKTITAS